MTAAGGGDGVRSAGEGGRVPEECVREGTLLRHLDGALPAAERDDVARHVERCGACRARLEGLESRDRAVRSWIREHDPEPPPRDAYRLEEAMPPDRSRGSSRSRWVLAATVVLALAGVALAGSVLARILDDGPVPEEPEAADAPGLGERAAATSFVPVGSELVIWFASPETRGRLTVEPATDSTVTLRVPSGEVELLVEMGTVRVRNAAAASGAYRLSVPPSVRTVRFRVPGMAEAVVDVAGLEATRSVRLPPGGDG